MIFPRHYPKVEIQNLGIILENCLISQTTFYSLRNEQIVPPSYQQHAKKAHKMDISKADVFKMAKTVKETKVGNGCNFKITGGETKCQDL